MGPGTAAANKYFELEQKINTARQQDYTIVSTKNGNISPYEQQRQDVVDRFFKGSYNGETKMQLLDLFEKINEHIKQTLGL